MNNMARRDLRHIWHPYTQMEDCREFPPVFIERAKGLKLYDDKGNFYYDTISSWWCNVHGHNHPKIKRAIRKQLDSLEHVLFAGFTHRPAVLLAERITSVAPRNLGKVFFSDNGSTSVECALKMSFQYWRNTGRKDKKKFVALDRGYHGDTVGAMSVSGVSAFNAIFRDLMFRPFRAPAPYCYRCPAGKERGSCSLECINPLEAILRKNGSGIAALILEPLVMAAGGMIIYPKEYLVKAASLAKKYNVHLIVDEVATGFGRTGEMFACDYVNIEPDFMCLSKGITSGYLPLGLTLTSDAIYDAFRHASDRTRTFYHGHTYTANPVSCAAALAALDIFREEDTLGRVRDIMPIMRSGLEDFRDISIVGDVRHIGMIGALELVRDRGTKEEFPDGRKIGLEIYKAGLKRSLILRPLGNIIYFFPPLSVRKIELRYILETTRSLIMSASRHCKGRRPEAI
ncbi:MAG: adenosylmethionine--8-amino-7-oxononanoate transaminase [Candidatus Omnitrophica bacterium]|nr:adenosylmethionine--8-amino-7-oxononanoate transaminase [Candidatus Omnitrophota bacterium]